MQDQQFNNNELKHVSAIREECTSVIEDEVDLSEAFELVYSRDISEKDVENYIMGLIFLLFETSSKPLQIQITKRECSACCSLKHQFEGFAEDKAQISSYRNRQNHKEC